MCVGFVSDINKARSLRKASSSINAKTEKRITAIFAKPLGMQLYDELVYITGVHDVYEKNETLLEQLESPIQMRFLEIVTRPVKHSNNHFSI